MVPAAKTFFSYKDFYIIGQLTNDNANEIHVVEELGETAAKLIVNEQFDTIPKRHQ